MKRYAIGWLLVLAWWAASFTAPKAASPEPQGASVTAIIGEFVATMRAPDVVSYYTASGGFYVRSDSMGLEWESRKLSGTVQPKQRLYVSQGVGPEDSVMVFDLDSSAGALVTLNPGRWFFAVEDTNYGLSGFMGLDVDSCGTKVCFDLPPTSPWVGNEPVYAVLGGYTTALSFPEHEMDLLYKDAITIRVIDERATYMRFAAWDNATRSWTPWGPAVEWQSTAQCQ